MLNLRFVTSYRFLLVYLTLLFTACSVNPVTGKRDFSIVSASDELSIGQQNYVPYQQQQGGAYIVDPELTLYVKQVGLKLAQLSDNPDLPYDFVVLNNGTPNAWALPGGKIAINRGLLVLLEDESQLAAVLAHEIVHAAARHGALQMSKQSILSQGAQIAGSLANQAGYGNIGQIAVNSGAQLFLARYGRQQELDSDSYGIDYMVRAGYDPMGAVALQETFVKLSEGQSADFFSAMFASHPPSHERVSRNLNKASSLGEGKRNRAEYQRAIQQILKDKPAYDLHTKALQAKVEQNYSAVISFANQAIAKQPKEALFYISLGEAQLQQKNYTQARIAFEQATRYNPKYYVSLVGLGMSQKALRQPSLAKSNLTKSLAILPTETAMYHLGELEEEGGNKQAAIQYYQQVSQSGGPLSDAALTKLQGLGIAATVNP